MNVEEAIEVICNECPDPYAKSYAMVARCLEGNMLRVQILYILSNLQYWRGERAREVKRVLKGVV